jgi:hypothetical protein
VNAVIGTSVVGAPAVAAQAGLLDPKDVAWALLTLQFGLYPLVFFTAEPVLRLVGQHLRAALGLFGAVLGLVVVLQFVALISW